MNLAIDYKNHNSRRLLNCHLSAVICQYSELGINRGTSSAFASAVSIGGLSFSVRQKVMTSCGCSYSAAK